MCINIREIPTWPIQGAILLTLLCPLQFWLSFVDGADLFMHLGIAFRRHPFGYHLNPICCHKDLKLSRLFQLRVKWFCLWLWILRLPQAVTEHHHLCLSARAAITKDRHMGGLNNRDVLSESAGGQKSRIKVTTGLAPSDSRCGGESVRATLPASRGLPATLGVPRSVDASFGLCLHVLMAFALPLHVACPPYICLCVQISPFQK